MRVAARDFEFSHRVPVEVRMPEQGDGSSVLALHGMGMDPASFARDVLPLLPPGAAAILPQAPYPFEQRGPKGLRQGNGWYVYTGESEAFLRSMEHTERWLLGVLDAVLADHALESARVSLLGYSQGGYLAGFVGLRHPARFRRLVVAAARLKHEALADAARTAQGLPVLCVHGAEDPNVAPERAEESAAALARVGLAVEFRTYPGGHAVLRQAACRDDVRAFLGPPRRPGAAERPGRAHGGGRPGKRTRPPARRRRPRW